jgi:hypothetical protein
MGADCGDSVAFGNAGDVVRGLRSRMAREHFAPKRPKAFSVESQKIAALSLKLELSPVANSLQL